MRANVAAVALGLVLATGCHHGPPPVVARKPPMPMTVFTADSDEFPEVAAALNDRVRGTFPAGATVAYAALTLEEAELAVGCADPNVECWNLLADPITTSALLVAEVHKDGANGVRLHLLIYDAQGARKLREAERVFTGSAEAIAGVPEVVELLVEPREVL